MIVCVVSLTEPSEISAGLSDEDLAVGKYVLDQAKRKKIKLKSIAEI